MRTKFTIFFWSFVFSITLISQNKPQLNSKIAHQLAELPLSCIQQEYPNKTAHIINNADEAVMSPAQLHPSFYGCFDWHSSVHGHWMLVKLLIDYPQMENRDEIIKVLSQSFEADNLQAEADYFTQYDNAKFFERTYGWAWLLKLDEELLNWQSELTKGWHLKLKPLTQDDRELLTWQSELAQEWHRNLQPLTQQIVKTWKEYLPYQTYPNRTGVHSNSAFALGFAIDWSRAVGDKAFEEQLTNKAHEFYVNDRKTPAYLEPDGADFFSPSLMIADLMTRVLEPRVFDLWFNKFYTQQSIDNISKAPIISDINDYQIVHLVGLSFSKAWCMKNIAQKLQRRKQAIHFNKTADELLEGALPLIFQSNYGGDHWLASFAVMALQ